MAPCLQHARASHRIPLSCDHGPHPWCRFRLLQERRRRWRYRADVHRYGRGEPRRGGRGGRVGRGVGPACAGRSGRRGRDTVDRDGDDEVGGDEGDGRDEARGRVRHERPDEREVDRRRVQSAAVVRRLTHSPQRVALADAREGVDGGRELQSLARRFGPPEDREEHAREDAGGGQRDRAAIARSHVAKRGRSADPRWTRVAGWLARCVREKGRPLTGNIINFYN